jgi:hypothetical protein
MCFVYNTLIQMATGNISAIHVFSPHGEDMLDKFLNNSNCRIIMAREFLDHDGCDKFGEVSNLWNLFVITQDFNTAKYNYYYFYTEDWFNRSKIYYTFETIDVNCICTLVKSDYLVVPNLETLSLTTFFETINNINSIKA